MFPSSIPEAMSSVETVRPVRGWRATQVMFPVVMLVLFFGTVQRGSGETHVLKSRTRNGVPADVGTGNLAESYGKIPLSFEPNRGQTDAVVQWVARGPEYSLFLSGDDAVLELNSISPGKNRHDRPAVSSAAVRMSLLGAIISKETQGEDRQAGTANYFTGNDPSKWQKEVPNFGKVRLSGVYPGVDLVYYGRQGRLEYDFVVAPGADPSRIELKFDGAGARLAGNGDLILLVAGTEREIRFDKPTIYQMKNGQRQLVEGAFQLASDRTVSFELGDYDRRRELVIDPTLLFAGSIATGNQQTIPVGMTIDATGAMYLTGYTNDLGFPVTTGALQTSCQVPTSNGEGAGRCGASSAPSAFVTKLSADGTSLIYSTYLHGGGGYEQGQSVVVDSDGDAYVLGSTSSNDFPVTANAYQIYCQPYSNGSGGFNSQCDNFSNGGGTEYTVNGPNLFIAELNPTGTALLYSTFFGGSASVYPAGIALDAAKNIYFASEVNLAESPGNLYPNNGQIPFPTTTSGYQTTGNNLITPALSKLSADGQTLMYSTFLGSLGRNGHHSYDQAFALGQNGVAFIGGYTATADFPTTLGSVKPTCQLNTSDSSYCFTTQGFVAGIDTTKTGAASLVYSSYLGGEEQQTSNIPEQEVYGLAADANNNLFVTGYTSANDFPSTAGVYQPHCNDVNATGNCNQTAFLSKINPTGSALTWSTYLGGTTNSAPGGYGTSIAFDAKGQVYLYGLSDDGGGDFPVVDPISTYTSGNKVFLATFSADATQLKFSTRFSGPSNNAISLAPSTNGLAVDSSGSMYIVGYTGDNGSFGTTTGTYSTTATSGFNRAFFAKISRVTAQSATTLTITPSPASSGQTITFSVVETGDGSTTAIPTGTVTLTVSGVSPMPAVLGTITLDGTGSGTFSTTTLSSGTYSVQAAYSGDSNFEPSQSATLALTVTAPLTTNLLLNPGAELGSLADWTIGGNGTPQVDSGTFDMGINPHTGTYDFVGGYSSSTDSLSQTVSIIQQGITAAQVDGGTLSADVSFWEQGLNQGTPSDDGSVTLTFLDGNNATISTVTTSIVDSHGGVWANGEGTYAIPVGTRSITYTMNFIKNQLVDNDAFIDDNSLSIATNTGLTIFPATLHFGNVPVGQTSASQTVSVSNQGTTAIDIYQVASELGANPADFMQTNNCPTDPTTLAAGASCQVTVTFTPGGVGYKLAGIDFPDDTPPTDQFIRVDGTGTGGILQVNPGNLKTIAGTGVAGTTGNGGLATAAELNQPDGVAFDPSGNLYIADGAANVIRKIDMSGNITTFAGTGTGGFSGDGGLATQAELLDPASVASDKNGNIYIQDSLNFVIRKVDTNGIITTFAGTPQTPGHSGDGGPATAAKFNQNQGARFDSAGNLYVPTCRGASIRKIDTAGNISTVAGNFTEGYSGDGGLATQAQLQCPSGVAIDAAGNLYIADDSNNVIRKVTASTGIISTIAGSTAGTPGATGDGGAATAALLNLPNDVALDAAGNLYIADSANNRVRKIDTNGVITTAAGGLNNAGSAAVNTPLGLTTDAAGDVYFSDSGNSAVREIFPQGVQPFPATTVGSTSAAQAQTLSNIGNTDVTLSANRAFTTSGNAGDFALTPGSCGNGTVLTANGGSCTLSITFTPTAVGQRTLTVGIADNALNTPQSFSIGGTGKAAVVQQTPVITWATPAPIDTATPLSVVQLDATAADASGNAVPGTFVYTPAAGTTLSAGTQTLSVTFTPTDGTAFTTATKTVSIVVTQVNRGTPTTTSLAVTSGGSAVTTVAAGSVVTLTAAVAVGTAPVRPAQVAFCDANALSCAGLHLLAVAQVTSGGTASFSYVPGIGVHSYIAVFEGTSLDGGSTSSPASLTVTGTYPTATTIAQSGTAGNYTLTATTMGAGAAAVLTHADTQNVSINLGQSAQNYVLTGTGASTVNGSTYGNYYNVQGSCVTSAATTTCDLTGPFTSTTTGFAAGTYDFQTVFSGSISSAVVSQTASPVGTNEPNDFNYASFAPSTNMTLKLNITGGGSLTIPVVVNGNFAEGLNNVGFADTSAVCGGTSLGSDPCQQDYVGTVVGATYTSTVTGNVQFELPYALSLVGPTGRVSFLDTSNENAVLGTGALGTTVAALGFTASANPNTGASGGVPLVGDFNGDGKMDLVVANSYSSGLTLFAGNGDGTFADGTSTSTTGSPHVLAAGDFNGDGFADIAVSLENFDSTAAVITVLLGSGTGTFTTTTSSITNLNAATMLAGDFNGDGVQDLAVVDSTTQTLTVLLGKGDGTFQASGSSIAAPSSNASLAVGDFNGDGKLDVVATSYFNGVQVLLGQGDGSFVLGSTLSAGLSGPIAVVAQDFNGDGNVDLAIANFTGNNVSIFLGNGDGTFSTGTTPAATQADSLSVGDFNGDGNIDLAVGNESGGSLTVLLGNGDGTFKQGGVPTLTDGSSLVATGDFNGDGLSDIVASGGTDNAVLLSAPTETATAMVTGIAPSAGTHAVTANYPGDANFEKSVSAPTDIIVGGAASVITWATPANIVYETALSATQLNATAATAGGTVIPGTFVYTPAAGTVLTVGTQTLSVTFTPSSTNYAAATKTVQIVVTQFTPVLTWATPAAITTTTPLSSTQLDAAATDVNGVTVPGTYAYTPAAGTTLAAGTQTLSVTFTPADAVDYTTAMKTVQIVVTSAVAATTTTTLAVTPAMGAQGTVFTLTAAVVNGSGKPVTGGVVQFFDNATMLGAVELVSVTGTTVGTATYETRSFTIGNHALTATFTGTNSGAPSSTASAVKISVTGKSATTTALTSTGVQGSYALTATVDGSGFGPTGNIVFTDSSTSSTLGTMPLSSVVQSFTAESPIPVGSAPTQLVSVDVNGDGKLDLVVGNGGGTMITVLIGNGDGTYTAEPAFGTNYDGVSGICVADFNGDGKLDIATANGSTVGIFLGNGDGTFGAEQDFQNTLSSKGVTAADFNGDGKLDLAVTDNSGGMTILIGNGDGTFTQPNAALATGGGPNFKVAVADFNGDGKLDIAFGNKYDNTLSVLLSNGDGTFQPQMVTPAGSAPRAAASGDFNGDGNADVVLFNAGGTVSILLGNGDGTFQAEKTFAIGANAFGGSVGDLNGDGKLDIAVANQDDGTVSVLFGNGDGTFQTQQVLTSGAGTDFVVIGDANGDGLPDLEAVNVGGNSVTQFINQSQAAVSLTGVTLPGTGMDNIFATYSGASLFLGSTSNTLKLPSNMVTTTVITWAAPANIVYGTALSATQLDATAATAAGLSIPGTFVYTPAAGTVLGAGSQTLSVTFTPTSANYTAATGSTTITVTKAMPVITWATPASVAYGTALSATQLDATVAGVDGTALAGTLVYTPALATVLSPGTQTLSVAFTPTDAVDYTAAAGSVNIVVGGLSLSAISPVGVVEGSANTTITLTGTGFVPTSVAQAGNATLVSTYVGPTILTAVVPASMLTTTATLQVTVYDSSIEATSAAQVFTVVPQTGAATLTGPATTLPGSQPTVGLTITNPYPLALTAVLNLTFASSGSTPVDDPSILFSNGTRSFSYVVAANSTSVPPIQLQAGTDAGTITITATLTADDVDVTPTGLVPLTIVVPAVVPVISGTTVTRSGDTLTVVIHGFSNTREVSQAVFDFTAATGDTLATPKVTIPATTIFSDWFVGDKTSVNYGSTFTYTQIFNTSGDASTIGPVMVTLTNSVGTSEASSSTGP